MTDHLGYLNGMPKERAAEVDRRWAACRQADHELKTTDTRRGDHRRACLTCDYDWGYDSGD